MTTLSQSPARDLSGTAPELRAVLSASRTAIATAALFSLFMNLLLLVPSLYMLQVYDRVLSTGSVPTLLMLTLIATFLFIIFGGLEWLRSQVMIVASMRFDAMLGPTIHDAIFARTLATAGRQSSAQPLEDLDRIRQFITGPGLFALMDAPWVPVYVVIMFVFHPWTGFAALFSIAVLVVFTIWTELATGDLLKEANRASIAANQQTVSHLRNAEAIAAMGMLPSLRERWLGERHAALDAQHRASARAGLISALSKTYRLTSQSLILGLGAYLAIKREISPGMVIAASILLGRALGPIDQLIGSWRNLSGARTGYARLSELLKAHPAAQESMVLPAVRGEFRIDKLVISPAGIRRPVIKDVSLQIPAGSQLAVIGPSAAGKSTLLRALLGLHRPASGSLRLDAIELAQYPREDLGRSIGYLPQDVELLDGTIAENIARFGFIDPDAVVKAARRAGVHEMIGAMPDGYETQLHGNFTLSAGQRQRVALARALYGDPAVVILDEPNSNLDEAGNLALQQALTELKVLGTTVVVVTHRSQLLEQMDGVMVLVDGRISYQGNLALNDGQRSSLSSDIAATDVEISATEVKILQLAQTFQREVNKELAEVQSELFTLQEKKLGLEDTLRRTVISAPQAGIVHGLAVHAPGEVIKPGAHLLDIVPGNEKLIVEAKLSPQDVDQIRVGQMAEVRFTAFRQREMPKIQGQLATLSADRMVDDVNGQKMPYYLGRVVITPEGVRQLQHLKLDLVAGMPADVIVKTGERTFWHYLTAPVTDLVSRSLKED